MGVCDGSLLTWVILSSVVTRPTFTRFFTLELLTTAVYVADW